MRFILTKILILFCVVNISAQNRIPNASFEDTSRRTTPLYPLKDWDAATDEGFNYFTPLHNDEHPNWGAPANILGYQEAKSGSSYIGIKVYDLYQNTRRGVREYAQVKLESPLNLDSIYCLQLYMSMADSFVFASKNQMGVYFSTNAVGANNATNLPYTPQIIISPDRFNTDKENWVEYNFEYQATGGEQYMTVGNFNDTTHLDTLFVSGGGDAFYYEASYYYFDDFYLGHCDSVPLDTPNGLGENRLNSKINVYPNPTKEQLFIKYDGHETLQVQLYNLVGQSVIAEQQQNGNQFQLSVGHLPKGVYLLEIIVRKQRISRKIIKR